MGGFNYYLNDKLDAEKYAEIEFVVKNGLMANPILLGNIKPKYSSLMDMTWGELLEFKALLKDEKIIEAIKMLYKVSNFRLKFLKVLNFFAVVKWINSEIETMQRMEANYLTPKEPSKLNLERFDYLPTLRMLANGDVLKYDDYLKLPYSVIFRELALINALNND